MILYELCFGDNKDRFFNLEISYKYFTDICSKYKLVDKGIFKEYIIDNTIITKSREYTIIITNEYLETELINDNLLLKKEINKDKEFNLEQFDYSDNEYKYNLYESNNDDVHIICKKYSEYITFSFESEKKENIINLLETIKNIYY